jgi:arylsulfatase A-like enzyme
MMNINWNKYGSFPVLTWLMGIFLLAGCQEKKPKKERPNIIIVLTDDQGYNDVGFTGGKEIPTPNIDRIAENGVHFTNGYVNYSVCSPSRAGLLTGRYQGRFGHGRNPILAPKDSTMGLPLEEKTLATVLNKAGYNSMVNGKKS